MSDNQPAVRVVTDSTACLPAAQAARLGIEVVPLHVVVDGVSRLEGVECSTDEVARAIRDGCEVSTSQPSTAQLAEAYARLVADGAQEIVSVHLSGELSGTTHAAAAAAHEAAVPVHVVDSRTVASGLGLAATAAALAAARGSSGAEAARLAVREAATTRAVFLVESLDHLRRGGRLSRAAAAAGTVLGLRPLLTLRAGRIEVLQKVRTRPAAVARVVDLVADRAVTLRAPAIELHYLDDDATAQAAAQEIHGRTGVEVRCSPVGAVIGAHVGPGLLAAVVGEGPAATP